MTSILFIAGLLYGVVTVGVPTHHPTPAIAAAEARNVGISGWVMLAGAGLGILALIWLAVVTLSRIRNRRLAEMPR